MTSSQNITITSVLLLSVFLGQSIQAQNQMTPANARFKWRAWSTAYGHPSALGLLNKRIQNQQPISNDHIQNALNKADKYQLSSLAKAGLKIDKDEINLISLINIHRKIDNNFSHGSSIDSREKWFDYIFDNMIKVIDQKHKSQLVIFDTGASHCNDLFLRTFRLREGYPNLENILYVGHTFQKNESVGNQDYADLLHSQGISGNSYTPKPVLKNFAADEFYFMMLLFFIMQIKNNPK